MIQFTDFYDDIDFMSALFFNGMLIDAEIYEIANRLNNKTPDDVLAKIIANGTSGNNQRLFENYLRKLGIKSFVSNRAVAAKIFYYILQDRIDFYKGIRFVHHNVSNDEKITEYLGDDIGIEEILGDFYAVDDGDLRNEKDIETVIKDVFKEMEQYVQDNLAHFSMDNTIAEDNKKTIIKADMEKAKVKALAKGIEIRDYWEEARKREEALVEALKNWRIMMQFTDFYDDIDFMSALFFNYMLNDADIYEIANRLNNKTPDDVLAQIIANGASGNNQRLFENYLNALGMKFLAPKRALIANVFYYILNNRIDFYEGIKFTEFEVSKFDATIEYIGDDVGISKILGNFYVVDDGDLRDEKDIETAIKYVFRDMEQYVQDNLTHFSMDDTIAEDNEKTIIKTEMEKAKDKAFARGIEIRDYWDKASDEAQKKNTG
ncbi:MAG: hypothetical protein LBK73_08180 [Treponema sp.]|jgi:hypothetical protein|nr:hypothetical protein [Treponema sp.]